MLYIFSQGWRWPLLLFDKRSLAVDERRFSVKMSRFKWCGRIDQVGAAFKHGIGLLAAGAGLGATGGRSVGPQSEGRVRGGVA